MSPRDDSSSSTANERFKRAYGSFSRVGLLAAVTLHFGLFVLVTPFEAADLGSSADEMESITLPPRYTIPPPPEQIARPAAPRVSDVDVSDDVTIPRTTFEDFDTENALPPPPERGAVSDRPAFVVYDTPPVLQNRQEVEQLLERHYPRSLKEAGIEGTVHLWVYVDEQGRVVRSEVRESSGSALLDEAAQRVAAEMRFSPAKNREKVTAVWVSQVVRFLIH